MATITEDYCSKEIYRLLIEKGFDGEIHTTFDEEGYTQPSITLQMAMKWLRKVHNILLFILPAQENGKLVYLVEVWAWNEEEGIYESVYAPIPRKEPEQAVEAALKHTLENLI